jgi:hypothetical protein
MLRRVAAFCLPVLLASPSFAQTAKGTWYVQWGYNRAWYGLSDIDFDGPGYAFTLRQVRAYDRPVPFSTKAYLALKNIWIPQYNYRLGWHFHDRWSLSLGLDHMKYVVRQDQEVRIDGSIENAGHAPRSGDGRVKITPDFLQYEHTDGLNLLSIDLDRHMPLWRGRDDRFGLKVAGGVHVGPVIPRTDVRLFGEGQNNRFNIAGFGVGAQAGLWFTFLRHFHVRNVLRAGWIDLPHVLTTERSGAHASQQFAFVQHAVLVGGRFRLGGKKD